MNRMALLTLNLEADAVAEARRLARARVWPRPGDEEVFARSVGVRPLVARARRSATRQRLAGRALLIFRIGWQDGNGRTLESEVIAAVVPASDFETTRSRVRIRSVCAAESAALPRIEVESGRLRAAAATVVDRFVASRLARERAIAGRAAIASNTPRQAGLFDRRGDRAHRRDVAATAERERQLRARLCAVERATIHSETAELVLVLAP
jgi:hypothetical protein